MGFYPRKHTCFISSLVHPCSKTPYSNDMVLFQHHIFTIATGPTTLPSNSNTCPVLQGMASQEMKFLNVLDVPLEFNIHPGVDLAKHQSFGPFLEILENASMGLRNLFRVQETTFAGSPGTSGDRWAVHLWDGNSKLAFAIFFRDPQSKAQTEALIWLIASVLCKRYNPTCLAWSHMTSQFVTSSGIFIRDLLSHPSITDLAFDNCDFVAEALTFVLASEKTKDSVAPNLSYLALLRCADVPPQLLVDLARAKDLGKRGFMKLYI